MEQTTFEICCSIRHKLLTYVTESHLYPWPDDDKINNIKDFYRRADIKIDPNDLTEQQMNQLMFGFWGDERLLPFWLVPFLEEEVLLKSIHDGILEKRSEIDPDHRYGYSPYLVKPKESLL